jgi:anti-sigma B factor antagonist
MEWTETAENGFTILKLSGEIDLQYSPALRSILQEKANNRCPILLVDFTGVKYIDSSGLATLIEYCRDARPFEGKLALFGLSSRVRTIFDLVRLNEILSIYPTLDDARAALKPKA